MSVDRAIIRAVYGLPVGCKLETAHLIAFTPLIVPG